MVEILVERKSNVFMCVYIFINIDINIDTDIGIDIEIISLGPLWVAIGSDTLVTMNMPKI